MIMDGFKRECKLCDNIISDENFKVVEEVVKRTFEILLLNLTLDNDTQNVICTTCASKLLAALDFKSTCLYTDNSIVPFVDFENPKPVDLKEVYKKEKKYEQGGRTFDDQEICRLCLQPMTGDRKSLQEVPIDSIELYIPEINFAVTRNPEICIKCYDALCVHTIFLRNCLDAEKRRYLVAGNIFLTNTSIKTEEIEIKSEDDETHFEIICNLEKGRSEEEDKSFLSQDTLLDTEETGSLYSVDDIKQRKRSAQSAVQGDKSKERICTATSESVFAEHKLQNKRDSEIEVNKDDERTNRKSNCQYSHKSVHKRMEKGKDPSELRMFECDECDFKCKHKNNLKKHQLRHKDPSEMSMFECDECDYKSKYKSHLKRHQLRHKDLSEIRMFECDECDFKFKYKNNLKIHQLRHKDPSEMQMFVCGECDYKSKYKHDLKIHQLRHKDPSEMRMLECDECDYKSKHKSSLKRHQLRHKDPSEIRMFECDECDYKCIQKGNLKKHQLRHKNPSHVPVFICDKCGYKSTRKVHLRKHMLGHKDLSETNIHLQ